jgi:enterochelin esterase-like enzyme
MECSIAFQGEARKQEVGSVADSELHLTGCWGSDRACDLADQFAYVTVWSAGVNPQTSVDFEKRNAAFLGSADKINKQIKLFSICVGDKDFALAGSKNLSELLNKRGIKNELHISGGAHTWINWRQYLNALAPRLLR